MSQDLQQDLRAAALVEAPTDSLALHAVSALGVREVSSGWPWDTVADSFDGSDADNADIMPNSKPTDGSDAESSITDASATPCSGEYPPPQFEAQPEVSQQQLSMVAEPTEPEWEDLVVAAPFQPQTLSKTRSRITGSICINWTIDARKLRTNDRSVVSPVFDLSDQSLDRLTGLPAPPLPFKMTITPIVVSTAKGGASFNKAKGKAIITLKCEDPRDHEESYLMSFKFSASSGRSLLLTQAPRGPMTCNFAQNSVCGLPTSDQVWDFLEVVDRQSQTFVVTLEVLPPTIYQ